MLWTLLGLYGGWLGLLFVLQRWLIFPTFAAGEPLPAPDGVEVVRIETAAGDCEALYWAPAAGGPAPAVVLFHGNAELVDHQAPIAGVLRAAGFAVLVPEYRGYGRCPGTPSQRAIVEDALRFVEQLAARPEVDAERIAYLGRSIGGAVALQVAGRRTPRALTLISPPAHVAGFAWKRLAPPLLVRHPFDGRSIIADLDLPVLIIHGDADEVVPVSEGRRLKALGRRVEYVELPGVGHNDMPLDWDDIVGFLARGVGRG